MSLVPDADQQKLPFNKSAQQAVLGHLLRDAKFFRQCRLRVKPHWFTEDPLVGKLWGIQLRLAEKLGRPVSAQEVKQSAEVLAEGEQAKRLAAHVETCMIAAEQMGLDYLRQEMTVWLESITFANVIQNGADLFNRGQFKQMANLFREAAREAGDLRFDEIRKYDFSDHQRHFSESIQQRDTAISTGLKVLDQALLEDATTGGLLRGDMSLVIAPSDVGKTTFMVTVAVHNIQRGKKVLFMTHEGRPDGIRDKFWQCLMRKSRKELYEMHKTKEGAMMVQHGLRFLEQNLTYIPYNKPGMTIEDVEPIIRRAQEDLMSKSPDGRGYDLVISDYPAKLWTSRAKNTGIPRREIDRIVYDYYVQLALEYEFHSMCAIQSNRDGSKVNNNNPNSKNPTDDRLLTKEDVSEAWGPVEMAQNVITINRSIRGKHGNRATFYVDKSKGAETGTAVVCRTRYDLSMTHHEELGGVYYHGNRTLDDKLDAILAANPKGQFLPLSQHLLNG